ncbi:MAG: hypothetical protein IJE73_05410 [Muribaculaceae bacterium]|nr:hypothetical protein [Muribaculaceae bacterium]
MDESTNDISTLNPNVKKGNILGLIGLIVGIIAWVTLYRYEWCGISFASLGIILSLIGLRGRFKNLAIGGLIVSSTLLIVVGIIYLVIYFLFKSI